MNTTEYSSEVVTQARLVRDLNDSYDRTGRAHFYTKMPEIKIVKFLKQFPWIRRLINADNIAQVYVSGIDPAMASRKMRYRSGNEFMPSSREYAFLVDESGHLVSRTVKKIFMRKKYIFFGPAKPEEYVYEIRGNVGIESTIEDTITRLGDEAEKIQYLFSFDDWTEVAIVYRRPKGADLQKWIHDELETPQENDPAKN